MELSAKIKSMKFMKRKEETAQRQQEESQHRAMAQQGHWTLTKSTEPSTTLQPRLGSSGANIGTSRQSFGQFNQETERLNEEERDRRRKGGKDKTQPSSSPSNAPSEISSPSKAAPSAAPQKRTLE